MNSKVPWLLRHELPEWPNNVAEELNKCATESISLPSRLCKQIGRIFFQSISTHAHSEYIQNFYSSMKITEAFFVCAAIFANFCYCGLSNAKILPKLFYQSSMKIFLMTTFK